MVMFRSFVLKNAKKLGLTGMVQNMDDGSVKVIAEGKEEQLNELLKDLKTGPPLSKVESVKETWCEASNEFHDFKILYKNFWDRI